MSSAAAEARSYLYVPGDRSDLLVKATDRSEADALILDLEDAVAPARKVEARRVVHSHLESARRGEGPDLWVRVNPGAAGLEDMRVVATPAVRGFCLAKAEADDVRAASRLCAELERDTGSFDHQIALMPLLETATAVRDIDVIATSARVTLLQVGEADLAAELGWAAGGVGFDHVRVAVVLASAAAELAPPVAPVEPRFDDVDRFRDGSHGLRDLGYGARACIHPAQVAVANEVFTPTALELEQARRAVDAFDSALAAGTAVRGDEGEMVDAATVRRARRTLSLRR